MSERLSLPPALAARLVDRHIRVIVVGGGGWLGAAALELLDGVYGAALGERVAVFGRAARRLVLRSGREIAVQPIAALAQYRQKAPLILHFAFLTRGLVASTPLAEYVAANRGIAEQVAATIERVGTRGLFMPSSGAVYRPDRSLDTDLAANPYGVLKLEDEARFTAQAARLGTPITVIRIFNLAGPFLNNAKSYALGSILIDIARGGPIVLKAAHPVIRAYRHIGDVLSLALASLLDGGESGPFDSGGQPAIEIGELARRAATLLGRDGMAIERPPLDLTREDRYIGERERFEALAGRLGLKLRSFEEQLRDTAAYLVSARTEA